jgi:sterol desaturase/sphingolipid hydroxylase (fatty acid hydroxylase superfamily)
MDAVESWISETAVQHPWVGAVFDALYRILMPPFIHRHVRDEDASIGMFALGNIERIAQTFVWYVLVAFVLYAITVRWLGKKSGGTAMFEYPLPVNEPGDKVSLKGGLSYILPKSFFTHPSFKIDMMWIPFSMTLSFLGLLGTTLGTGAVHGWMAQRFGHSVLAIPNGGFAIALQVIIMLLARDFGRFMWHYQGHSLPFFWEFHKVHHSAEVLHPFGVRTHPVDMFIRNTYMGAGGGLIAGALIWTLGMEFSLAAASYTATALGVFLVLEHFEHSHVSISFGKTLNRFFYAPFMHHFHHGAAAEHMNVNLGITGGLTLWDYLFGTLYWPKKGEKIVWGASYEELGDNNPHRTIWGLFWSPFVAAFRTLKRREQDSLPAAASAESAAV